MPIELSNRELALLSIVGAIVLIASISDRIRPSLGAFLKNLFHPRLVVAACWSWVFAICGVWLLAAIGLWDSTLLKETVVWAAFSGLAITFRGVTRSDPTGKLLAMAKDQLKVTVVFEFLFNLYSLSYIGEIVLLSTLIATEILAAVAESNPDQMQVAKWLRLFQALVILPVFGFDIWSIASDPQATISIHNVRSFLLPMLLTVWMLPFGYAMSLYSGYQWLFIKLSIGDRLPKELLFYSKLKLVESGGLRANRLRRIDCLMGPRATWAKDHDDLDGLFSALKDVLGDPELNEAGDLEWPRPLEFGGERIDSMKDYLLQVLPILERVLKIEEATRPHTVAFLDGNLLVAEWFDSMKVYWQLMDECYEALNDLPQCSVKIRKLDRHVQAYISSCHDLFWIAWHDDSNQDEQRFRADLMVRSEMCVRDRHQMMVALKDVMDAGVEKFSQVGTLLKCAEAGWWPSAESGLG